MQKCRKRDQNTKLLAVSLSKDKVVATLLGLFSTTSSLVVLLIFLFLGFQSFGSVFELGLSRFLFDSTWLPEADSSSGTYGILAMLVATLATSVIALLIAAPLGVLVSSAIVYFLPTWISRILLKSVELLAGIPSVVLGLWGLVIVVPYLLEIRSPGLSLFAGGFLLSVMITPTIIIGVVSAFNNLEEDYRWGSESLGLSRTSFLLDVVLPLSRSGVYSTFLLAFMRAIGETMVVLMVCGNVIQYPGSILDPVRTITGNIALEMSYAYGTHQSALFFSALLLMGIVVVLLCLKEFFLSWKSKSETGSENC